MAASVRWASIVATSMMVACAATEQAEHAATQDLGTLVTAEYELRLHSTCAEGEVSCAQVYADLISRRDDSRRALQGSTIHTLCADGVSPCRFVGYQLSDREYDYRALENGRLQIQRCQQSSCESVYSEQGRWQYQPDG